MTEEVESLPWKTIIALVVIFLIAFAIYLIATEKDVMYNLCKTFFKAIDIIPFINPSSIACSGLR